MDVLVIIFAIINVANSLQPSNTTSSVDVRWLGGESKAHSGVTFGVPWPQGQHFLQNTSFTASDLDGNEVALQSWTTGHWRDGSVKWTGHAVPPTANVNKGYTVKAVQAQKNSTSPNHIYSNSVIIEDSKDQVKVDTGKISFTFPKSGNSVVSSIKTASGKTVGKNGKLLLHSQSAILDTIVGRSKTSVDYLNFESKVEKVSVSKDSSVRALITVRGKFQVQSGKHDDWLPFILRFYFYQDSEAVRLVHSIVFDGDKNKDFLSGLGIRFQVPLVDEELYDRHVRISGGNNGFLNEAVQGITGLRRNPGENVTAAQLRGEKTPDISTWDTRVSSRMQWIPVWNDFSLQQLTPDGFNLKKRTKPGQGWLDISAGTRSDGVVYLGGATKGGLALGLGHFWQQFPTGLDISSAGGDAGEITLWLHSPDAEPLDLRTYHDGLGQTTYEEQLDALEITYEDFEPGFDTPYGIGKTSDITIWAFDRTPASGDLSRLASELNKPPVLYPEPAYVQDTKAIGSYWSVPDASDEAAQTLENNLDFLFKFYQSQVEEHRWYGFLHYGDIMHSYDADRHAWRYDVGGYAWANSELSPDLFFWQYFLRTGREDVYRFAEAMTRHTSEVDMYHVGQWKGLGTRHGVQHWVDSAKQVRISQPQYRKYFFYVSGGDERVGEVLEEALDTDQSYGILDPGRKVRDDGWTPEPGKPAAVSLGTDWSALAAGWLIEWERRGPRWEEARDKLINSASSIANLTNGYVTSSGLYDNKTGIFGPPPSDPDNEGRVSVGNLAAMFGMPEVISELLEYWGDDTPTGFAEAWFDYCYFIGASSAEQKSRYGSSFGSRNLVQGHSRLSAYYASHTSNQTVANRAWVEFFERDGLKEDTEWLTTQIDGPTVLNPIKEAAWVSTNTASQYGLAAIQNLAYIRNALKGRA